MYHLGQCVSLGTNEVTFFLDFVLVYTSLESSSGRHQRSIMYKSIQEVIYFGSIVHRVQNVPPKLI